ncbi:MAG: ABC transporter permease [Ignavibacteriales bacterium]|nr:ABC transporter permease [Ignavibacteriales bacterium]
MSSTFFIARRFLQFQKTSRSQNFISFITLIAIIGIMLGVGALIIALTILGGFEKDLKEKVIGFTTHIQITTFSNQPIRYYENVETKLLRDFPKIKTVSAFISKEGMVNFGEQTEGIIVKGIESVSAESGVRQYLVLGNIDFAKIDEGMYGCVIGKKLLNTLGAHINDTLLVFGLQGHIQTSLAPNVMAFVVRGVYESGMSEYDDVFFYTGIPAAQELINFEDAVSGFEVVLHDVNDAPETAKEIMDGLGYPFYARTLFQLYRNLFTWIELQKEPIPLILGLIITVAAVNIIGTLLMLVLEKRKQIGILKSLGASSKQIRNIFLLKGVLIAFVGTILGNIFAYLVCWTQLHFQFFTLPSTIYFMKSVPIYFQWENFAIVSGIGIILCLFASIVPARLAAKLDPIKAIRLS